MKSKLPLEAMQSKRLSSEGDSMVEGDSYGKGGGAYEWEHVLR